MKLASPIVCTVVLSNLYLTNLVVWLGHKKPWHFIKTYAYRPIGKSSNRGHKRYTGLAHCLGKSSPESKREKVLSQQNAETLTTHLDFKQLLRHTWLGSVQGWNKTPCQIHCEGIRERKNKTSKTIHQHLRTWRLEAQPWDARTWISDTFSLGSAHPHLDWNPRSSAATPARMLPAPGTSQWPRGFENVKTKGSKFWCANCRQTESVFNLCMFMLHVARV